MGSTAVDMIKNDSELELAALLDPFAAEKKLMECLSLRIRVTLLALMLRFGLILLSLKVAYENTHFAL